MADSLLHPDVRFIHLNGCGVSPLCMAALEAIKDAATAQSTLGIAAFPAFLTPAFKQFRIAAGKLFQTTAENMSFVDSCAAGLNLVASALPLAAGDEVIVYRHEYPSNFYPWKSLESRGVVVKEIQGTLWRGLPFMWTLEELENLVTRRTKVVAVSHVQFTSGFACDLDALGKFCAEREIFLVLDAAQSVGYFPLFPEKYGVAALVTSGCKWLTGPVGASLLYTSKKLREIAAPVFLGPDHMKQGDEYLDHRIQLLRDGRIFEYSTIPYAVMAGLGAAIEHFALKFGLDSIWKRNRILQRQVLDELRGQPLELAPLPENSGSGILSFVVKDKDPMRIAATLRQQEIIISARGMPRGPRYLRIAPHFFVTENEITKAMGALRDALKT